MSKNYFKGIMRGMREFTAETDSNKARYDLTHYLGDLTLCPSIVTRDMWRYFQPEDTYTKGVKFDNSALGKIFYSTEEVDKLFWSQFVGIGSPDLVSSTADDAPVVQYFFSSVEALSEFIEKSKKGLTGDKAKEVTESILHECPEQYRYVYDEFQRNGTVSDLNNFNESI